MVAATNPTKHWCAPGDGLWLLERGRNRPAATWWMGAGFTGKIGQRGDHRPRAFKTGHRRDHQLRRRETVPDRRRRPCLRKTRSEEHTSELQSPCNLVCRLLLERKK